MTTDLEKSFKAKLRAIAKEKNRDPADLWQTLALERFLVRLGKSQYREHFVLKGGILLSKYIEIRRETTDLDFLARKINNEVSEMKNVFEKIARIDLQDGFLFNDTKVNELTHPHMEYSGVEVAMIAYFGKTRFKVAIDVGFGDVVDPIEYSIPLTTSSKGSLFEGNVTLPCYPKEFIFAEKLETLIHRGSFNSRMKDFHDLYSIISSNPFPDKIDEIILTVFAHRETKLTLPIFYKEDEMKRLQNYWNEYLKNLREENLASLPKKIHDIIAAINNWLQLNTKLVNFDR